MSPSRGPTGHPTLPRADAAAGGNELALISFMCSLALPLAVVRALLAAHAAASQRALLGAAPDVLDASIAVLMDLCAVPATFVAIAFGHRALRRAGMLPATQARSGLARTGLVLGYLAVAGLVVLGLLAYLRLPILPLLV